jgi:hypothetical protein
VWWRGRVVVKKFKINLKMSNPSKYFQRAESRETLSSDFIDVKMKTEFKSISYSTGATYNGKMLGGLRHGEGLMNWADGAYYVG